jgi:hypothetical protein
VVLERVYAQLEMLLQIVRGIGCCWIKTPWTPHSDAAEERAEYALGDVAVPQFHTIRAVPPGRIVPLLSPFHSLCWAVVLSFYSIPPRLVVNAPFGRASEPYTTYSSPPCLGVKSHDRVNIWTNRLPCSGIDVTGLSSPLLSLRSWLRITLSDMV